MDGWSVGQMIMILMMKVALADLAEAGTWCLSCRQTDGSS